MANPVSIFSAAATTSAAPTDKLRQQAQDLEGVFLNTLMKEMFSGVDSKGAFGGGFAEETWRGMQSEQYASAMAGAGGIGLADQLVRELVDIQQASNKGSSTP